MSLLPHQLELLAPAKNVAIAKEAILHGADAVYIGGPYFGARHNASNSVEDIADLARFAHLYHARVFVTINTILHDSEVEPCRQLIHQLYNAGVDALIVQDMGILEMDIPPIEIHASTQCDIRSVEKAKFLSQSGFSQLVLPRELTIQQIAQFAGEVDATLEYFVHGALCVAFSGQCYISHAETGRSANRGDCSQACRLPYTLQDSTGGVVAFDKHLLSMKDNNQSANLEQLIDAGVRSFKIEGRYKDMAYVKNITAHYRQLLDEIIDRRPEFARASSGETSHFFEPDPDRNFHRGSTDYFATGRQIDIGAFDSPKFLGAEVGEVSRIADKFFEASVQVELHNGDGINYLYKRQPQGVHVNRVERVSGAPNEGGVFRVFPRDPISTLVGLRPGLLLHRNRDHAWDLAMEKSSAQRQIAVWGSLSVSDDGVMVAYTDEDGTTAHAVSTAQFDLANHAEKATEAVKLALSKSGGTAFSVMDVSVRWSDPLFIPTGELNRLRRTAIDALQEARLSAWDRPKRRAEVEPPVDYPEKSLSFLANVYNDLARAFYRKHGVEMIAAAYEAHEEAGEVPVMITKHCLRFSFNLCPKQAKGVKGVQGQIKAEPMTLVNGKQKYTLKFDCKPCEMHIMGKMRKNIFQSAPPTEFPVQFITKKMNQL